ncbi:hypothetical protein [Brassicibacter mesophilus]|uniref:hypothetical protein n=1 Tax=Brassicibacter mesophilus TaxID=745119 RepID=UPI003D23B811
MYKFLLIEDSKDDVEACLDTIERMNTQNSEMRIEIVVSNTFRDALKELEKEYNGVIVDINLDEGNSGNFIIRTIIENYRLPVAVMTGTPDTELEKDSPIKIYKKGEASYEQIVNNLIKSCATGLFNVIGGKGIIQKVMNQVFWNNLYPQIQLWENLYEQKIDVEKILLRYSIAHIQELIDDEVPNYITEEMYIKPPINDKLRTGSIIKSKKDGMYCVVLSPPCDLVLRDGIFKTDRIMLCEIDSEETVNQEITQGVKQAKMKKVLLPAIRNNYKEYYHWLPSNSLFKGGYINFRSILTYTPVQLKEEFCDPELRIQEYFIKSILNRFSSYYARQGQPDFNFDAEAEIIIHKLQNTAN